MKGLSISKAEADAHNARVNAEAALFAKLTPEERRRHMEAKSAGKKSPVVMDEFKRLGLITEKPHDNNPRPEIPHSEQRQRTPPLENRDEAKASGTGCPHVCFTLSRVRLLDVDAKFTSCKDLIDGLQHAGLICGDKEGEITLEVNQKKVAEFALEQTEIMIIMP